MREHRSEPVDVSVVVPTFRNAIGLPELVERVIRFFDERDLRGEVILVNDASPDATWPVIEELARGDGRVVGIDLLSNHGQAEATLCGLAQADGVLVATMDDDLQQWPEDLGLLLDALDEHPEWDAAIGAWDRDQPRLVKRFGSWVHGVVDRWSHSTPPGVRYTSFRLMRRPLVDALVSHETRTPVLGPLITRTASSVHNVEVRHSPRRHGGSTITVSASIRRVVNNVIQGTTWPLQVITALGLTSALLSFSLGAVFTVRWLAGANTPPGWASVFLALVFFSGMTLIGIATIGRYLSVIVQETQGRPKWSIRRTTTCGEGTTGGPA